MRKSVWLICGITLAVLLLVAREWLVHEEIDSLQSNALQQIQEHISNAPTVQKIKELQASQIVYARYLEPVLLAANRLLWLPTRSDVLTRWERDVHIEIQEKASSKLYELETGVKNSLESLKTEQAPSIKRLIEVVKQSESGLSDMSCSQTVQDEVAAIQKAASDKDQEVLASIKTEGISRLQHLKATLRNKGAKQVAQYLTSGSYYNEIEKPVLDLTLQIKQEELRKKAWAEFQKKLSETLDSKTKALAKSSDTKHKVAAKNIEKIADPVTQALQLDQYFANEELSVPSDSGAISDENPVAPSDSQLSDMQLSD